ncbi:hypothetical protein PUN28_010719 [Cardiocondyla obscurior]|uniref:Uncharacterized protein n=1 Tax=Cardiocondyla obscurior TaxID=286306 RepID=A0AAW2FL17_9HYME
MTNLQIFRPTTVVPDENGTAEAYKREAKNGNFQRSTVLLVPTFPNPYKTFVSARHAVISSLDSSRTTLCASWVNPMGFSANTIMRSALRSVPSPNGERSAQPAPTVLSKPPPVPRAWVQPPPLSPPPPPTLSLSLFLLQPAIASDQIPSFVVFRYKTTPNLLRSITRAVYASNTGASVREKRPVLLPIRVVIRLGFLVVPSRGFQKAASVTDR